MFRSLLACVSLTAFAAVPCFAETPAQPAQPAQAAPMSIPTAPQVDARSYIVTDHRTDKILAAKDAVVRVEPASLTKLMTAYIVFQELSVGKLKLDEQVTVSEHAWRSEGSRTFIELGKPVSVQDLILGMIVQSGNDATIALAERIAGTEETFAQMMNANAKRLGMIGSHFENSSGLPSPQHYTTARDLSLLANAIIREYPQDYKWFSVREFEHNGIKQQNRNGLLEKDPTVDGLKTGHTDSAGFCLVTSAQRDGMRLVSVVMGSTSMKARENASAALLNYGFTFYDTKLVVKGGAVLATARVWKGQSASVDLGIKDDLYITLARGAADSVKTATDIPPRLIAPLALDTPVGTLRVFAGAQTLATIPMHPQKSVAAGGWWRRLIDTIRLWFA
jgi:serine-type D-Ala-D-Ala carboxypeptidase (penicillin-binding protein 5/6)